jgi:NAD-dependent SIR2 family protein deacetylase
MEEWYCFKCKEKMEEADISMEFMEIVRFVEGIKCPKCGVPYLSENTAEAVVEGEKEIEAKF